MAELTKKQKKLLEELTEGTYKAPSEQRMEKRNANLRKQQAEAEIAPVKTTNDDKKWYQKIVQGSDAFDNVLAPFKDGYNFGDITKTGFNTIKATTQTILGTGADIGLGAVKGVAQTGEGIGKLLAGGVAQVSDWIGQDEYAEKVRRNLATKEAPVSSFLEKQQDKVQGSSVIGDTGDKVSEAIGYIGSIWASGGAGTGVMFSSGSGNALQETYQKAEKEDENVEDWQVWTKSLGTGLVETATEKLFGIFGTSGLDKAIANKISAKITSGAGKVFSRLGVQATGEAVEEFLSYAGSQGLDYMIDVANTATGGNGMEFKEDWNWEEVGEQMAVAFMASGALGGGANIAGIADIKKQGDLSLNEAVNEYARQQDLQEQGNIPTAEDIQAQIEEKTEELKASEDVREQQIIQEEIEILQEELVQEAVAEEENIQENAQEITEEPTYYHGTRGDFETFDNSRIGQNYEGEWSSLGKGFYFTNNYESAKEFGEASTNEGEVNVKEAKLDIKNPYYVDELTKTKNFEQLKVDLQAKYDLTENDFANGYVLIDALKSKGLDTTEVLKEYGYDGIVADDEVVVFDSNQIKNINKQETTEETPVQDAKIEENASNETQDAPVQEVMTEEEYLESKGYPFMGYSEAGLHKTSKSESTRSRKQAIDLVQDRALEYDKKREELRKEYQEKVESGEIRKPNAIEKALKTAQGHEDNPSVQASRRLLEKRGIDWKTGEKINTENIEPTQIKQQVEEAVEEAIAPMQEIVTELVEQMKATSPVQVSDQVEGQVQQDAPITTVVNKDGLQMSVGDNIELLNSSKYTITSIDKINDEFTFLKLENKEKGSKSSANIDYVAKNLSNPTGKKVSTMVENDSLKSSEAVETQNTEAFDNITDEDAPPSFEDLSEVFDEVGESDVEPTIPSPLEERDIDEVGSKKVKAYQYEHPEIRPYFQYEAENMLYDLDNTIKGERIAIKDEAGYITEWAGTTRQTAEAIAYLKDNYGYSYEEIRKGLNAIIEDHGAENIAVAKRIEFMLDERLREGYTTSDGIEIPANEDYIKFLEEQGITAYNLENFNAITDEDAPIEEAPVVEETAPVELELSKLQKDRIKEIKDYYKRSIEARKRYAQKHNTFLDNEEIAKLKNQETAEINAVLRQNQTTPSKTNENIPTIEKVEEVVKDVAPVQNVPENPNTDDTEGKQRRWAKTSTESETIRDEIQLSDLDVEKITYVPITNRETLGKANKQLESLGYDKALESFKSKLTSGMRVKAEDVTLGQRLMQEALKRGDKDTAIDLLQDITILGTEIGQATQALSIIQRLTPAGQLKMLEKTVNRAKAKGDEAFENVEITKEMKEKILDSFNDDGVTYDQDKLNKTMDEIKQELAQQIKATNLEKVNAWRYLAMLGNPKTHIRNLVSNVAMYGTTEVKNVVARTIETVAPVKERTKTFKPSSQEVKDFANQTAIEMKEIISGDSKYNDETGIRALARTFETEVLEKAYNFNSDLLEKEDWWFSGARFKSALSEFLTANDIKTEEDIFLNPELVEKGKAYALEQSRIATFRQYSYLANKIREVENKNTATNIAVGSIIPFKKTPINVAKAGLSYSPLGLAKAVTYDIAQVKNGKIEASQLVDNLSQGLTGTGLALVGYMLAMSGFLSGAGDDDEEAKYDYQLGKQSYAVNIGGKSYSLSWLSPVAMPLFVGANAYSQLVEKEEWNGDVVVEALGQTLDPLNEMSFVSGLVDILSSYESGTQAIWGMVEAMGQNYATQFFPTLGSQIASVTDDTKRSTKVASDSDFKFVDETINKIMYKVPGLRQLLEPSTDIWGNEVKQTENILQRALETFIAPYSAKESTATEIDENIKSVFSATGDSGVIPNVPRNTIKFNNETYKMSGEEYTNFKKTYGQTANDLLEDLFRTTTYKTAGTDEKAEMINEVYKYSSDIAKKQHLAKENVTYTNTTEDGEKVYRENTIKEAIKHDMTKEEYKLYSDDPEEYKFLEGKDSSYRRKYFDTQKGISDIEKTFNKRKDTIEEENMDEEEYKEAMEELSNEKKRSVVNKIINSGLEDTEKASLYKRFYNSDKVDIIVKSAINVDDYLTYTTEDIKADYKSNGKAITGSRKKKVIEYVDSLDMDIPQKAILIKATNTFKFNDYNNDIVEYVDSINISFD